MQIWAITFCKTYLQVLVRSKLQYGETLDNVLLAKRLLEEVLLLFSAIGGPWRFLGDDILCLALVGRCLISVRFF